MVYATEETPLGTAGSVRNAMDELDERFLVISGDVLTDIDLGAIVDFHDEHEALATIGLVARREPARVRHRDHPRGRLASSASSRSRRGARCSATPSTPASSCSSRRSSTTSTPTARSTSPARCSRSCSTDGPAALRRRRRGLLGGRRHPRRLRPGPQGHPRRQGAGRHPRLRAVATACGWARAPRSTPRPIVNGPAVIGDNCRIEAGARIGQYTVLGANVRVRHDAAARAVGRQRQRLPRRGGAAAGRGGRPGVRPAQGRAGRGGRGRSATSASSARTPLLSRRA